MARKPYHLKNAPKENVYTELLKQGVMQGIIPARTAEARRWYRDAARGVNSVNETELMRSEPSRFRQSVVPGRMYMFYYDPKLKDSLPYYDQFPLIFPLEVYGDRFLGLNLHYLPYGYRAKLMDALYALGNNTRYDATTKIQLSYKILKAASATKYYKPCVKMYLKKHVRSRFVSVGADEWDIAIFLPTERFEKAEKTKVWSDSTNKIRYGK